jgi:hypothetical protein
VINCLISSCGWTTHVHLSSGIPLLDLATLGSLKQVPWVGGLEAPHKGSTLMWHRRFLFPLLGWSIGLCRNPFVSHKYGNRKKHYTTVNHGQHSWESDCDVCRESVHKGGKEWDMLYHVISNRLSNELFQPVSVQGWNGGWWWVCLVPRLPR